MEKKGFEMSFSWIFAILVGVVILFLAIYFATRIVGTGRENVDAQTSAKLSILLDPLETSIGETKINKIIFGANSRIYNDKCRTEGNFGEQRIGIASYSFGKWKEPTYGEKQYNKYIFSQDVEEGREFYVFVKSFDLPFKVSDIIVLTSEEYCFIDAPGNIKQDLEGIKDFHFTDLKSNCSEESKKVCFSSSSGCDVSVYGEFGFDRGYVSKEGARLDYIGELIYAAIFSSPEVYECNVERLRMRLINLCSIYKDEIKILSRTGCQSNLDIHLTEMINLANNANLMYLQDKSEQIKAVNNAAECSLFES
jgi:hypothetical protein